MVVWEDVFWIVGNMAKKIPATVWQGFFFCEGSLRNKAKREDLAERV